MYDMALLSLDREKYVSIAGNISLAVSVVCVVFTNLSIGKPERETTELQ